MSDTETNSARLDALEIRLTHQDQIIDDLNAAIIAQWHQIDRLTRQLSQLRDFIAAAKADGDQSGLPEKPPPHY